MFCLYTAHDSIASNPRPEGSSLCDQRVQAALRCRIDFNLKKSLLGCFDGHKAKRFVQTAKLTFLRRKREAQMTSGEAIRCSTLSGLAPEVAESLDPAIDTKNLAWL